MRFVDEFLCCSLAAVITAVSAVDCAAAVAAHICNTVWHTANKQAPAVLHTLFVVALGNHLELVHPGAQVLKLLLQHYSIAICLQGMAGFGTSISSWLNMRSNKK